MPPLSIMVKPVSGQCNMRCRYCFYGDVTSRRGIASYGAMSMGTLENLVRRALAYADGQCNFAFQGGEPTLAGLPFYEKLIAWQQCYNTRGVAIQNSIQTNGYVLTDEMANFFTQNRFLVGVSLDGMREMHDAFRLDAHGRGTFDAVQDNIERLKRAGAAVNILCVVNRLVAKYPSQVFQALKPYGFIQFIACLDNFENEKTDSSLDAALYGNFLVGMFGQYYEAYFSGHYVSIRAFDNYIGMLLDHPPEMCSMNGRCGVYYLIEADGGVYPCDFYALDHYRMGNINDDSFYWLEKSPVGVDFRRASHDVDERCKTCRWYALCRGGCRRDREPKIAGELSINQWCASYQYFFTACYAQMVEISADIRRIAGHA
ncbi:MAG: anaerobic sulfatase maturase [Clostridia bacterium]